LIEAELCVSYGKTVFVKLILMLSAHTYPELKYSLPSENHSNETFLRKV
jgi:hypothetical protein